MARPDPARGPAAERTRLMRAVHAACRQQGLDEEARRDLQLGVVGKASMGDMDAGELARLLARLNRGGRTAARPHAGKVLALWWSLHWLGAVDRPDARAVDGFVRRQTGVSALRFLDHRQAHAVVEALKDWAAREGVDWPRPSDPIADRLAVLAAIGAKLGEEIVPAGRGAAELDATIRAAGRRLRLALDRP